MARPVFDINLTQRRTALADRRSRPLLAIWYGAFRPRRRAGRRELDHQPVVDLHGPALFASATCVLLLCVLDAFLTLELMQRGAIEANPAMAPLVYGSAALFAVTKLALTGVGIVTLVAVARFRLFKIFRAGTLVHVSLLAYLVLIGYELTLLNL